MSLKASKNRRNNICFALLTGKLNFEQTTGVNQVTHHANVLRSHSSITQPNHAQQLTNQSKASGGYSRHHSDPTAERDVIATADKDDDAPDYVNVTDLHQLRDDLENENVSRSDVRATKRNQALHNELNDSYIQDASQNNTALYRMSHHDAKASVIRTPSVTHSHTPVNRTSSAVEYHNNDTPLNRTPSAVYHNNSTPLNRTPSNHQNHTPLTRTSSIKFNTDFSATTV